MEFLSKCIISRNCYVAPNSFFLGHSQQLYVTKWWNWNRWVFGCWIKGLSLAVGILFATWWQQTARKKKRTRAGCEWWFLSHVLFCRPKEMLSIYQQDRLKHHTNGHHRLTSDHKTRKYSSRWDKSDVSCISPPGITCQYVYVLFVRIDLAYFSVWQFFNNTWIHTLIAEHFPLHTWRVKSVRCSHEIPTLLSLYEFLWVNLSAFLPRLVWQVRALTPNSGSMKSLRWWGLVICLGPFLRAPQCCLGRVTVQCEVTAEQSQRLKGIKGRELLN